MMLASAFVLAATFTRPLERVASMDPSRAQSVYESRAVQLVYESPLEFDYRARPYRLSPGACELPEVSEDGLTYIFRMRRDDSRSPAERPTAADMVRSLERLRDPQLLSPNAWMLKSVDCIETLGDDAVKITLRERQHVFPWLMAMSPASIMKADGSGTGEYELKSWRKNHEMVFQRRHADTNGFDTVRYLVIDDASTQWLMFLKGELDFLGEISRDNWDAVVNEKGELDASLTEKGVALHSIQSMTITYLGMNMKDPVLGSNRKLRQALNAGFDSPEWERYFSMRVVAADGPVPPDVEGRLEEPFAYSFNLEKAKRLMAEAGYPDGVDPTTGRRLTITLAIGRASQDSRESGELIASFYEKLGIRLELKFYTWDAYLKAVNEGRVQLFIMSWVGDYPDAENFLQLFHSRNLSPGPNHSAYVNTEFDREYDLAMASATAEERDQHWLNCQRILREDCPWVFCNYSKSNSLVHKRVGNYVPSVFPYGQERFFTVNGK